jgi:tetratricopeptide (TPR) repeat protein
MASPGSRHYNYPMNPWKPAFALLLFSLGTLAAPALDRIVFEQPLLGSQDADLGKTVDAILERTRSTLATLHGDSLAAAGGSGAAYALKTVVSRDAKSFTLTAVLRRIRDDAEASPIVWLAQPSEDLPLFLARSIFARWSLLSGNVAAPGAAPVFVDEFSPEDLRATPYPFTPTGVAVQADGTLLVAFGAACWQLDRSLRIVGEPGSVLAERGDMTFAYGVMVTPSGSIILKPGMGKDLYRIAAGAKEPQRLPIGTEPNTTFLAAAPDGSIVAVDIMGRRAFRLLNNRKQDLPLYASASHTVYTFAVAPDGSIWVWDHLLPGFRIHTAEGAVADFVLPLLESSTLPFPLAASIGPDGSFVLFAGGRLMRFSRDGALTWNLERIPGAANDALPQAAGLAVDWKRGLIYLDDISGRRIVKLLDRELAREARAENPFEEKLAALRAGKEADDPVVAVARARMYEDAGSFSVAKAAWRRVSDLDPGNAEAGRRFDALELAELRRDGDALAAKAIARLREVGIENARPVYQEALKKYELALARAPGDAETQRAVRELQRLFSDPEAIKPSITIIEARVAELFPSMMQRYRDEGIGTVTVKNTGAVALQGVVATASLPSWFDAPIASTPVDRLEPGASALIGLRAVLLPKVLENDEDQEVSVTVAVSDGSGRVAVTRGVPAKLHRRSALTWEETGRIAAFITPQEETVSVFAAHLAAVAADPKRRQLSAKLARAIGICEGLAAYGLSYVEDPTAPISKVLGAAAVDTVRFARDTLLRKAGDCDDTTVLLASALESAGIRTAVLTTPGHIFLAFDSGESVDIAADLAAPPLELLSLERTAWIPVETTLLKDGFVAAWSAASALVRKHRSAGLEVLPVHLLRDRWPALPLPKSAIAIAEPAASAVSARYDAAVAGLDKAVYAVRLAELETAAKGLTEAQALRVRIRQGILHALYGKFAEAEKVFSAVRAKDPSLVSPHVNLATLSIIAGDLDGAIATLRDGLKKVKDPSQLTFMLARCYLEKGDSRSAALYLAETRKTAPQLAAQLSPGASVDASSGRGSFSGGFEPYPWSSED